MTGERVVRRLAAILAADVAGYSRLMGADEEGTLARLKEHRRELIDPAIARHRGRVVKTTGDGLLVEFASAVDAVACAVELQECMRERNAGRTAADAIAFRIGINLGDIIVDGDDIHGDGVNVAARLEAQAPPGGVVVAGAVHDAVAGRVTAAFEDLGDLSLKNIARPVRAYRLRVEGGAAGAVSAAVLALPDKPSIAVLPFQNISGDPEQEYFVDGLVEDIITALSRFKSLFVIARNSSFTYKGKAIDIKQVGRELGVRYVLEGSVRKAGGRLRITGQLVDSRSGAHLWADRFDGALGDVFDLQDRITTSVAGIVASALDQAELARAATRPVSNLDAYDVCLHGIARLREGTREANDEALSLFYRAIEIDPAFAMPYGMAMRCYSDRRVQGWNADKDRESAEVRRLAAKVSAIGQDEAHALASAGQALCWVCHDYDLGEALVDQALRLNPNSAFCLQMHAYVDLYLGKHEAAIDNVEKVLRLNPLDPEIARSEAVMAYALILLGRYKEAIGCAVKAHARRPGWLMGWRVMAIAQALDGNLGEARRAAMELHRLDPGMRIANLRDFIAYRRPQDVERLIEGLRLAGLPE